MAEPFISQISAFGLGFTIRDWVQCQGQILAISQNQALYSLISDIYGGDGINSMGVPNLKGRTVLHSGSGPGLTPRQIGSFNSLRDRSLTSWEMPAHAHPISQKAKPEPGTSLTPSTGSVTAIPEGTYSGASIIADWYAEASNLTDLSSLGSPATAPSGNSAAIQTISPYQVVMYEMAFFGAYPPRS